MRRRSRGLSPSPTPQRDGMVGFGVSGSTNVLPDSPRPCIGEAKECPRSPTRALGESVNGGRMSAAYAMGGRGGQIAEKGTPGASSSTRCALIEVRQCGALQT